MRADGRRAVVGLDYDAATLRALSVSYAGVSAVRGNLVAMPYANGAFDAVVSLQVVEHIWEQPPYVAECARVLRPGGLLALSTPNRLTFSPGVARREKPLNPFHVNEFDPEELVELVTAAELEEVELLGIQHTDRIVDWERQHGSVVAAQLAEPYDRWSDELSELVRSITTEDFVVGQQDPEASLDLLVLASRANGDE